MPDSA